MRKENRKEFLLNSAVGLLRQAEELLRGLDDSVYAEAWPGIAPHRAGSHMRHILEFFECFLDGLEWGRIDYDARKRNLSLENHRSAAAAKIRALQRRLTTTTITEDRLVLVRMEDAPRSLGGDAYVVSSAMRELQALCSHTTHHFALIALVLRVRGVETAPDFGMAPSTLRYLASAQTEATVCAQ